MWEIWLTSAKILLAIFAAEGHLELSDFLQNWWAVLFWDPQ